MAVHDIQWRELPQGVHRQVGTYQAVYHVVWIVEVGALPRRDTFNSGVLGVMQTLRAYPPSISTQARPAPACKGTARGRWGPEHASRGDTPRAREQCPPTQRK